MSLFRDSWEVWRRKVNEALGGLAEPVKAEDVTYDNTDSGLTATDVQSAIDEIDGDVDDIKSALTGYLIPYGEIEQVSVTADGVKTISALSDELHAAYMTMVNALEDDECILITRFDIGGVGGYAFKMPNRYVTKASPITVMYFNETTNNATSITANTAGIAASNSVFNRTSQASGTTTYTDMSITVPSADTKLILYYQRFKKL